MTQLFKNIVGRDLQCEYSMINEEENDIFHYNYHLATPNQRKKLISVK